MKKHANGAYFKAYDSDTAITIVNAQSESETAVQFAMEHSHLDLSRLLSDTNRKIERGNNINLTNLLTLLGNDFQPEQEQQADATPQQAFLAATMCTTQRDIQRRSEPKDQPTDTESNKPGKLKHKYCYEQG